MHQPITSTSNWFLRRRRYIPKPRVAAPAAHPGFTMPRGIQTPTGFYKCVMPAYRSFVQHEHRHARRAIVQPRWGNHIAVHRVTRGTRRCREPRAMECNAFGVRAIGHIVRLRDNGPSGTRSDASGIPLDVSRAPFACPINWVCINQSRQHRIGFYAEGVTFQSPGSPRQRRTLGLQCRAESKPQRGFTNAGCPRTDRSRDTNIAMHVGRLSNPVGVTVSPCTAYPGYAALPRTPGYGM